MSSYITTKSRKSTFLDWSRTDIHNKSLSGNFTATLDWATSSIIRRHLTFHWSVAVWGCQVSSSVAEIKEFCYVRVKTKIFYGGFLAHHHKWEGLLFVSSSTTSNFRPLLPLAASAQWDWIHWRDQTVSEIAGSATARQVQDFSALPFTLWYTLDTS